MGSETLSALAGFSARMAPPILAKDYQGNEIMKFHRAASLLAIAAAAASVPALAQDNRDTHFNGPYISGTIGMGAQGNDRADTLVYGTEKTLSENRDRLSAADVEPVEQALAATKKALEGGDHAAIEAAAAALQQASHKLAEALYKQASAGAPTPEAPASGEAQGAKKGDGDVIDAEVVDEK
jgi:hypothetical protein